MENDSSDSWSMTSHSSRFIMFRSMTSLSYRFIMFRTHEHLEGSLRPLTFQRNITIAKEVGYAKRSDTL